MGLFNRKKKRTVLKPNKDSATVSLPVGLEKSKQEKDVSHETLPTR